MAEAVVVNKKQKEVLSGVMKLGGKVNLAEKPVDKRTVGALESRGLVKLSENRKGQFMSVTAKGKKLLN
jgi:predicted transcriptional regulator